MNLSFVETMRGELSPGHPVAFHVRASGGLDGHLALSGVVHAAPWVDETTCEGTLDLSLRRLAYDVRFRDAGGRALRLHGEKHPSARSPLRSMTVLPVTLVDEAGGQLAQGELTFDLLELPQFLASWLPLPTRAHRQLTARRLSVERHQLSLPGAAGRGPG
jgi:hypothetical protein